MKWFLGVDPGQKGGLAVITQEGAVIEVVPMPATVTGIVEFICRQENSSPKGIIMVAEKAQSMPGQGAPGGFNYGRHFGCFEAICACFKIPYHEVRPNIWKKDLKVSSDKQEAIGECERIFPKVELVLPGCRKKHDGMAEALLIAEWGRRKGL